ncbi:hypothetical protein [Streptomyces sp. NPDC018347]|uniref:hypothetical protein n=1 Tax=Streptomyces sp. NPDC018347 TaxID=3157193 RepID=UPI0034098432
MLFYITAHPDKEHRIPAGEGMTMVRSTEPGISEAGYAVLSIGMLVCTVTAITLVIASTALDLQKAGREQTNKEFLGVSYNFQVQDLILGRARRSDA